MDQKSSPMCSKKLKLEENASQIEDPPRPLPEEVLSMIFGYLKPREKLQCFLVCEDWNLAMQSKNLHFNLKYNFVDVSMSAVHQVFMKSTRPIYNLVISFQDLPDFLPNNEAQEIATENSIKLFGKIGQNVRQLFIKGPVTNDLKSLECFPLLQTLIVVNEEVIILLQEVSPNITHIHIEKTKMNIKSGVYRSILLNYPILEAVTANEIILNEEWPLVDENGQEISYIEFFSLSRRFMIFYDEEHDAKFFLKPHVNLMDHPTLELRDVFMKTSYLTDYRMLPLKYNISSLREAEILITRDRCWFPHYGEPQFIGLKSVKIHNCSTTAKNLNCKKCMINLAQCSPNLEKILLIASTITLFEPLLKFGKGFKNISILTTKVPIQPLKLFQGISPKYSDRFSILKILVFSAVKVVSAEDWNDWPELPNLEELRIQLHVKKDEILDIQRGKAPNPGTGIENVSHKCRQIRYFEYQNHAGFMDCSQVEVLLKNWPFLKELIIGTFIHIDHLEKDCEVAINGNSNLIKNNEFFQ